MNPSLSPAASAAGVRPVRWRHASRVVGAAGLAWNLFGIVRWASSLVATPESLVASGLTRAQADLYLALPAWMSVAFAVGVFAGAVGSLALVLRHRSAPAVLTVSLAAYALLFAGDGWFGIFSAMPRQLVVLCVVMVVAVGLLVVARRAQRAAALR